ncbi:MAG: hypothetical protein GWN31_14720, partial [Candidatus Thorarchaeota archaeon]|nr:hypothetical protein [Candidatus Thorarchaeota archaeon]
MLSGDDSEEAAEEADVAEEVPTEEAPIEADMEDNGTLMDEEQEDAGEIPEAPETPEIPSVAVALPPDVAL